MTVLNSIISHRCSVGLRCGACSSFSYSNHSVTRRHGCKHVKDIGRDRLHQDTIVSSQDKVDHHSEQRWIGLQGLFLLREQMDPNHASKMTHAAQQSDWMPTLEHPDVSCCVPQMHSPTSQKSSQWSNVSCWPTRPDPHLLAMNLNTDVKPVPCASTMNPPSKSL